MSTHLVYDGGPCTKNNTKSTKATGSASTTAQTMYVAAHETPAAKSMNANGSESTRAMVKPNGAIRMRAVYGRAKEAEGHP